MEDRDSIEDGAEDDISPMASIFAARMRWHMATAHHETGRREAEKDNFKAAMDHFEIAYHLYRQAGDLEHAAMVEDDARKVRMLQLGLLLFAPNILDS